MKIYNNKKILKIKENSAEEIEDFIAVEKRLTIAVNGKNVLNLYCTPSMIREFVVGIIYIEGLISGEWCAERISIEYGEDIMVDIPSSGTIYEGPKIITSGCAGGVSLMRALPIQKVTDAVSFHVATIKNIFREFQKRSEIYRLTGGVHSAALTDGRSILAFSEDIGRHNAVDKVIGYFLLEHISFEGKIMLASGRLSSEIIAKCARCGIPVVISRAAPTSLAVEIAETSGITIVGFMRGDRMNVYTGRERIAL
jgi:FdhD protein